MSIPLTPYERHLILCYLANTASRLHYDSQDAKDLIDWVVKRGDRLNLDGMIQGPRCLRTGDKREAGPSKRDWEDLCRFLEHKRATTQNAPEDTTARRIRQLGETLKLSRTDVDVLNFMLRYKTRPIIKAMVKHVVPIRRIKRRELWDDVIDNAVEDLETTFCYILDDSEHTVQSCFKPDAPLLCSGLICINEDRDITLMDRLRRLATIPDTTDLDPTSLLLGAPTSSEFEWSDFDHLAHDRDHVERLLKGALRDGKAGVNILLYGSPGTGKTEFCKVLADKLGATLYSIGESDEAKREPSRTERLNELKLAQNLVGRDRTSILLFDEMDDLLSGSRSGGLEFFFGISHRHRHGESKVFMNRLLEENTTPTLWTTNSTDAIDPTILRRMMFTMELRTPTPTVRARIWARQLSLHGIEANADDALALAKEFDATPGVAAGATAAAKLAGGGLDTVRHGVRNLSRVLSCEKPPQRPPERFNPTFIRADQDLIRLADRLAAKEERRFSLCLQGPPGTGKSAFVRYLAERLGLEIMQKRASDLFSMWVGETEQNIAKAFAEARDQGAFLVFDEADSLLADRRMAQRGWEISQVNEMLTWMENHRLPFACTINLVEKLDPATLRRFTFKIRLDNLTPEQAAAMFRAYFNLTPPQELATLSTLTPGDFAVVRRAVEVLDLLGDARAIVNLLRTECEAKPDQTRKSGFYPDQR